MDQLKNGLPLKKFVEVNQNNSKVETLLQQYSKKNETKKNPFKRKAMSASKKSDSVFVIFLTRKNEIQTFITPIYVNNAIIIKEQVYIFDPRAAFSMRVGFKMYKCYVIKEIDRFPISNLDLDEVRASGDSTEHDAYLIRTAIRAHVDSIKKPSVNPKLIWLIGIVIALAVGAYLLFGK